MICKINDMCVQLIHVGDGQIMIKREGESEFFWPDYKVDPRSIWLFQSRIIHCDQYRSVLISIQSMHVLTTFIKSKKQQPITVEHRQYGFIAEITNEIGERGTD